MTLIIYEGLHEERYKSWKDIGQLFDLQFRNWLVSLILLLPTSYCWNPSHFLSNIFLVIVFLKILRQCSKHKFGIEIIF